MENQTLFVVILIVILVIIKFFMSKQENFSGQYRQYMNLANQNTNGGDNNGLGMGQFGEGAQLIYQSGNFITTNPNSGNQNGTQFAYDQSGNMYINSVNQANSLCAIQNNNSTTISTCQGNGGNLQYNSSTKNISFNNEAGTIYYMVGASSGGPVSWTTIQQSATQFTQT